MNKELINKHLSKVNPTFIKSWIYLIQEVGDGFIVHYKDIWDDEYLTESTYCLTDDDISKIHEMEQKEINSKIDNLLD
jgi:hypothetical protein